MPLSVFSDLHVSAKICCSHFENIAVRLHLSKGIDCILVGDENG